MDVMESYILRIYRYQPGRPQSLVGVVERPESEEKLAFTTLDELWAILSASKGHALRKSPASGRSEVKGRESK